MNIVLFVNETIGFSGNLSLVYNVFHVCFLTSSVLFVLWLLSTVILLQVW